MLIFLNLISPLNPPITNKMIFVPRIRIDEIGSLVVQRVRKEDQGRYQCSAKNLAATRDSRPVRLKIHGNLNSSLFVLNL